MNQLTQISDLKAVSGGYSYTYTEFVTEDTIFYNSVLEAMLCGLTLGALTGFGGYYIAEQTGAVLGALGAGVGAYLGYNYNDYSDITPNTWITWYVTQTYY